MKITPTHPHRMTFVVELDECELRNLGEGLGLLLVQAKADFAKAITSGSKFADLDVEIAQIAQYEGQLEEIENAQPE